MLYKKRILAAKIETTVGTPIALAGADAAMNVFNLVANPTATSEQRPGQGSFGQRYSVVGLQTGQFTFQTEVYGVAGAAPSWLQTLFAGCGVTYSAGVFSPRSEAPGANVKTLTLGAYTDGVYKQIAGAMGNVAISAATGSRILLDWTFMGRWTTPTDVPPITPTYPTAGPAMAKAGSLSVGSSTPCISNFTFDLGNVVSPRPCLASIGGIHSFIVTDRLPVGTIDPQSTLVATDPLYSKWINSTEQAFEYQIEVGGDTRITIAAPAFQIGNIQEGDRGGLQIDTITYQLNRIAADSDFTITFAEV